MDLLTVPLKNPSEADMAKPLKNLVNSTYSELAPEKLKKISDNMELFSKNRQTAVFKVYEKFDSSLEILCG